MVILNREREGERENAGERKRERKRKPFRSIIIYTKSHVAIQVSFFL